MAPEIAATVEPPQLPAGPPVAPADAGLPDGARTRRDGVDVRRAEPAARPPDAAGRQDVARRLLPDDQEQRGRQLAVTPQLNESLDTLTFELRDAQTDELLRQVPPEELVQAQRFVQILGLVVDRRA